MTDPFAPPSDGRTPPPRTPSAPPPRPSAKPWAREAVPPGVALLLAAFFTVSSGWALLYTLFESLVRAVFDDQVAAAPATPAQRNVALARLLALAGLALVTWVAFCVLVRRSSPHPLALLPWGLLGAALGLPVGFLTADVMTGLYREAALRAVT